MGEASIVGDNQLYKFNKLFSYYNALYDYYYQLINLHFANKRNSDQFKKIIFYIKNISELVEEYVNENITIEDAQYILEYTLNKDLDGYEGCVIEKIRIVLNTFLSKNYSYNETNIIKEMTQEYIEDSLKDEGINIESFSSKEIRAHVYNENQKEIIKKAQETIKENIIINEISNNCCLSFLMFLQKKIMKEKDLIIKSDLIVTFYETIFLNDDVQNLFILNDFKLYNSVRTFDMYEGYKSLRYNSLSDDVKDDITEILFVQNEEYDYIETKEDYILNSAYLKAHLFLLDSVSISLLKLFLEFEIKKLKVCGKYKYFFKSVMRLKRCFEIMEKSKEKEEEIYQLEYIKKLNILIKYIAELSEGYSKLLSLHKLDNDNDEYKYIVGLIKNKLKEIDEYTGKNISIEDLNDITKYIIENNLSYLVTTSSLFSGPMFNIVIDRILNAAKETTILDYNNVVNLLIKKTYNKKENMTNSQMEEISKNALNFIHKNIILYQTSYEINTKFLSKLLEIINITSEDSVRILLTDYYYKVIFINGRIENDVIENNFIVDSTKLNSNNNLSEEDIVEKTKNLFYELIDISDDKHKDNFYAAYSIIIFTYLNTCLELLNINTIEKMENEFNFEIYEALSDELKNSIAENHKILRDIFSNVKNNKRKIKR